MENLASPASASKKRSKASKKKKGGGDLPPPNPSPSNPPFEAPIYDTDPDPISANEGDETDINSNDPDSNMPSNRQRVVPKREADISVILTTAHRADLTTLVDSIMEKLALQSTRPFDHLHLAVAQVNRVKVWNYGPAMEAAIAAADNIDNARNDDDNNGDDDDRFPEYGIKVYGFCKPSKSVQKQGEEAQAAPGQTSGETGADSKPNSKPLPAPSPAPAQTEVGEDADDDNGPKARTFIIAPIDADSVKATVPSMSELQKDVFSYFSKWKNTFQKRFNDLVVSRFPVNPNAGLPGQGQGPSRGGGAGAGPGGRGQQLQQVNRGIPYQADLNLIRRFPPTQTPLTNLSVDKRRLLIHTFILMLLSTEHYISFSRLFLMHLASSLHIPFHVLVEEEQRIAQGLGKIYKTMCDESDKREAEEQKKFSENKADDDTEKTGTTCTEKVKPVKEVKAAKKYRPSTNPLQAGATLLAAGVGTILAAQGLPAASLPPVTVANLLGALSDNESALATFFGANPARPTVKSIDSFSQILQDCGFVPVYGSKHAELQDQKDVAPEDRRMRLIICINGLLTDKDNVVSPWERLGTQNEVYAVRWEMDTLEKIGGAFDTLLKSKAWDEARQELIRIPIMTTLLTHKWPNALLRVSKIVDNAWIMGMTRSTKLSNCLSEMITGHLHGERGVTLIGYGVGARSIYLTLSYLAERRLYGLVDNVVLMGAPIPSDSGTWSALKSVVAGRFVNVFANNDYMLAFASRSGPCQFGVAGLGRIEGVGGVENHDVSDILGAHSRYPSSVGDILQRIGWDELRTTNLQPTTPPQPTATVQKTTTVKLPASIQQTPSHRLGQSVGTSQHKENSQPQGRGGKTGRGGRGGRGRGGRGGRGGNNNDTSLAGQMGKISLK